MYVDAIVDHSYHKDMYIIIIIMPNNKIIDLIVSLPTAAYSINCRLFFTNVLLSVRIYR